jgi:hypothetical protein
MTVHQLKSSMTADEFNRWLLYDKYEPLHSTDIEIAQLSLLASAFMGVKDPSIQDFLIHKPAPETTAEHPMMDESFDLDTYIQNAYN